VGRPDRQTRGTALRDLGPVWSVDFTPDGSKLSQGTEGGARFWDLAAGRLLWSGPARRLRNDCFYPGAPRPCSSLAALARCTNWPPPGTGPASVSFHSGDRSPRLLGDGASVLISGERRHPRRGTQPPADWGQCSAATAPWPSTTAPAETLSRRPAADGRIALWDAPKPLAGTVDTSALGRDVHRHGWMERDVVRELEPRGYDPAQPPLAGHGRGSADCCGPFLRRTLRPALTFFQRMAFGSRSLGLGGFGHRFCFKRQDTCRTELPFL